MKLWIQDQGIGSLQGMEYNNFRAWMNNQRNHFVKYYDQQHKDSDTEGKCDEGGKLVKEGFLLTEKIMLVDEV